MLQYRLVVRGYGITSLKTMDDFSPGNSLSSNLPMISSATISFFAS